MREPKLAHILVITKHGISGFVQEPKKAHLVSTRTANSFVEAKEDRELESDSIFQSVETLPCVQIDRPDRPDKLNWRTAETGLALVVPKKSASEQDAPSKAVSPKAASPKTTAPTASSLGNQRIRDVPRDLVGNILHKEMSFNDFSALFAEAEEARELQLGPESIFQDMETFPHLKSGANPGARRPGSQRRPSKANWQTAKPKLALVVIPKTAPPKPALQETMSPETVSSGTVSSTSSGSENVTISKRKSLLHHAKKKGKNIKKSISKFCSDSSDRLTKSDIIINRRTMSSSEGACKSVKAGDTDGSISTDIKLVADGGPKPISKFKEMKNKVKQLLKMKNSKNVASTSKRNSQNDIPVTAPEISLTTSEIIRRDIAAINKTQRKALAMKVDEIPSDVPISCMSVHERRQTMDIELEKADLKGSVGVSMVHEGSLTPIISRKSSDEKVSVVSVKKAESEAIKEDVSVPVTIIGNPPAPASSKTQWIQSPPAPTSGKAETTVLVADEIPPEVPIAFNSVKKIQMQMEQVKAAIEVKQIARQRLIEKMPELNMSSEQEISSLVAQKCTVIDKNLASERRGSMSPDILEQIKRMSIPSAIDKTQVSVSKRRKGVEDRLVSETKNLVSEVLKNLECQKVKKTVTQRLMEKMPELNLTSEDESSSPAVIRHSPALTSGKTLTAKPVLIADTIPPVVPTNFSLKERKKQMEQKNASSEVTSAAVVENGFEARNQSLADLNELLRVSNTRVTLKDFLSVSNSTVAANEILRVLSFRLTLDDLNRVSSSTSLLPVPAKKSIYRSVTPKKTEKTVPMTIDMHMASDANTAPLVDRMVSLKLLASEAVEKTAKKRLQEKMPHLNFSSEDDTPSCHDEELQDPVHQEMGKERLDSERRGSVTPDVLEQIRRLSTKPASETKRVSVDIKQRNMGETLELKPVNSNEIEKTAKQRLQEKMPHLNFSSEDDNPSCHDEELQDPAHQEMGKEPLDSERRGSVTPDVLDQIRRLSTKPANETKSVSVDIKQRNMGETLELKPVNSKEIEKTVKKRLQEKMPHLNFSSEDDTPSCHDEELQDPVHQEMGKERLDSERRGSVTPDVLEQIRRLSTKPANEIKSVSVDIKQRNMGETLELKPVNSNEIEKTAKQRLQEKMPHLNFSSEDDTPSCHNEELQDPAHQEMGKEPLDSERRGSVTPDVLDQIRRLSTKPANETKSVSVDIKQRNVGETLELKPVNSEEIKKTAKQSLQEKMPHLNFSSEDDTPSCHDEELQDPAHQEMVKENGYVTYYCIKELVKDVKRSARQRRQERMLDMASGDESGSLCSEISASEFVPSAPTSGKTIAERFCLVADEVTPEAPIGVLSIKQLQEKKRLDMEELANVPVTSGEKTSDKEMSLSQAAVKQKRDQMMSVLGHKHDEMESPSPVKFTPRTVAKANVDDPPDHWLQLTPSRMLTPEMDPPSPPELTPSTSFCKFDSEDLPPMPCVEEPKLVKKTSRTGKSPLKKSLKEVSLDLEMRLMAPPQEIVADSISQARSRYSSVSSLSLKSKAAAAGKEPKVAVVQVGSAKDKSKKKRMKHFFMKGFAKSKMCLSCFRQEEIEYKPL